MLRYEDEHLPEEDYRADGGYRQKKFALTFGNQKKLFALGVYEQLLGGNPVDIETDDIVGILGRYDPRGIKEAYEFLSDNRGKIERTAQKSWEQWETAWMFDD